MSNEENGHKANALVHETSPYLLQHAYNPVDWKPWSEKTLALAKKENKMMIISVGYAACHWCHVMERESFEDEEVARIMNESFVCIKVDREERPDIDDVYMSACQLISGQACGWPLNAFALPDGKPVWAGTYFPKHQWLSILDQLSQRWSESPDELKDHGEKLSKGIQRMDLWALGSKQELEVDVLEGSIAELASVSDDKYGGRQGSPKFVMPAIYEFLLTDYGIRKNGTALDLTIKLLDNIGVSGTNDLLAGGFARYSVDERWQVPHFEKMLYDNGQLMSLYAAAYGLTGDEFYKQTAQSTADFLLREMADASSDGFYSSYDADSEGEEGKYYDWTMGEIEDLLTEDELDLAVGLFDLSEEGNWEDGRN